MTDREYCLETLYRSKSNFRAAFFFLPREQREELAMVYSLAHRLDSCADDITEVEVAQKQLNFWHQELEKIFSSDLIQPLHPISRALRERHLKKPWPQTPFYQLLDAMHADLHHQPFQTQSQLDQYCFKVASTIGELIFHITSENQEQVSPYCYEAGLFMQKINILRDLGEDLRRGRYYIPQALFPEVNLQSYQNLSTEDLNRIILTLGQQIHQHALQIDKLSEKMSIPFFITFCLWTYRRLYLEVLSKKDLVLTHKISLGARSKITIVRETLCHKIFKLGSLAGELAAC